jgi:hypothetical protein
MEEEEKGAGGTEPNCSLGANAISVLKGNTTSIGKFDTGFDLYEYHIFSKRRK